MGVRVYGCKGVWVCSLKLAAEYFNVEYRTIKRHLDTKTALSEKVYLFSKGLDSFMIKQLKNNM